MDATTLRNLYLNFFREHGHVVIGSAPLIPEHDPSVLFTTAGMHPLAPFLLGEPHPAGKCLVNEQIRRNLPVSWAEMGVEDAKRAGAIGLFEQRYGDCVKVCNV